MHIMCRTDGCNVTLIDQALGNLGRALLYGRAYHRMYVEELGCERGEDVFLFLRGSFFHWILASRKKGACRRLFIL